MLNPFSRTELLLGRDAMERLASSRVADIYKTRVDPPARVMRRELKKRDIHRDPKTILRIMEKYELLAEIRRRRKWGNLGQQAINTKTC